MPIDFPCTRCDKMLRTPDGSEGRKARCPDCGAISNIPNYQAHLPEPPVGSLAGSPLGAETNLFATDGAITSGSTVNPYDAPQLPPAAQPPVATPVELRRRTFGIEQLLTATWRIGSARVGDLLLLGLVMFGLMSAGQLMALALTGIVSFLVHAWVTLGAITCNLRLARTGQCETSDFFAVGKKYGQALLASFLITLIMTVVTLLAAVPTIVLTIVLIANQMGDPSIAIVLGAVSVAVALPVLIRIWWSLYLTIPFVADRNVTALEAMKLSREYMHGNKLNGFVALVVVGFLGSLGVLVT